MNNKNLRNSSVFWTLISKNGAFTLVMTMLIVVFILAVALIGFATVHANNDKYLEYCK